MHTRSACSRAAQPSAVWPEDAQQPEQVISLMSLPLGTSNVWQARVAHPCDLHIPNIVLMTPRQGFVLVWSGFRTRSLGRGGSLGADAALARWLVVFFPATMVAISYVVMCIC